MTQNFQPSERASVWRQLKAIMDRSPADGERVRSRFTEAQLKRFEEDELSKEAVRSLTHPKIATKFAQLGIDVDRTWVAWAKEVYDPERDWLQEVQTRSDVVEALRVYQEAFGPELLRVFMDGESVHQFFVTTKSRSPAPKFLRRIVAFLSNEARHGAPVRQMTRAQLFYWKVKRTVFGEHDLLPRVTDHKTYSTWVESWYRPKSRHSMAEICGVGPNAFRTWIKGSATPTQDTLTGVLRGVMEQMPQALEFQPDDPKAPLLELWTQEQDREVPVTEPETVAAAVVDSEPEAVAPVAPTVQEPALDSASAPAETAELKLSDAGNRRLISLSDLLAEQADEDTDVVKHLAAATKAQRARRARADALFHFVRSNEEERERQLAQMRLEADERVAHAQAVAQEAQEAAVAAQEAANSARQAASESARQLEELRSQLQVASEVPKPPIEEVAPVQVTEPEQAPSSSPSNDMIAGRTEPGEHRGDIRFVLTADNWTPITDSFTPGEVEDTAELIYELGRRLSVLNQMDPELRFIVVDELAGPLRSLYLATNNLDAEERPAVLNDIALSLEMYAEDKQN